MSIHDDHRNRVRERVRRDGLDNFEEHQVLELLLFYSFRRGDTNELAHRLMERFGSFSAVLDADPAELEKVTGCGPQSAFFLSLLGQTVRYYQVNRTVRQDVILNTIEKCGYYLMPRFTGRRNEAVYMLCLDAKCKVLCCEEVGEGSVNFASVPIRRIVETAMNYGASSVVLAHNHPSGLAFPSDEDVLTTRRAALALSAVEILLVDHIIVADDDFVSLVQSGRYDPDDCRILV